MKKFLVFGVALIAVSLSAGVFDEIQTLFGTSATKPGIYVNRARGHSAGPELLGSGDTLWGLFSGGYNGSAFTSTPRASIQLQTSEAWSTTANGTQAIVQVTPAGSVTPATVLSMTGSLTTIGTTGLLISISTGPRTNVTPSAAGQIIYNSTGKELCFSTGTAINSWVLSSNATTACSQ